MGLSTKLKVIFGFTFMVVAIGVLAFEGLKTSHQTNKDFEEYSRVARLNVTVSDIEGDINKAAYFTFLFGLAGDEKFATAAIASADKCLLSIKTATTFVKIPKRLELLEKWKTEVSTYKEQVIIYKDNYSSLRSEFVDEMSIDGAAMKKSLEDMIAQSRSNGNTAAIEPLNDTLQALTASLYATSKYIDMKEESFRKPVEDSIAALKKNLSTVAQHVGSENKIYMDTAAKLDNYTKSFDVLEASMKKVIAAQGVKNSIEETIFSSMTKLNEEILDQQNKLSANIKDSNESAFQVMMVISAVGTAVGIIIAIIIVLGLVRILTAVAHYAGEISRGHFGAKLTMREPGELGMVVSAMQNIPEVLGKVVTQYNDLGQQVVHGHLRNRGAAENFQGEYGSLVKGTNDLLDSIACVLDTIPAPIIIYDLNYIITYTNASAIKALGNIVGKECPPNFRTPMGQTTDPDHQPEATFTLASGKDMTVSISSSPNTDATGKVVGAITVLNDITAINEAQVVMVEVAREANQISERVATAAEQLSAQVEQISNGAEIQRDQVASTATAMEEMNATVLDVARNAGQASDQADSTRNKANDGADIVAHMVQAISRVNDIASSLHKDMHGLGEQAEAIGGVMDVISNIADQTNLLALNAAIEAARAGDAGRGFAVVADEVRKLAENTMSATSEVGSSIKAIQESAAQNIKNVGDAVISVTEANEMASSSGQALRDIVSLASDNSLLISGIATAAEEQSATSEEINHSIDQINQIAGETATGMAQSAEAVQELNGVAQELKNVLQRLNEMSTK